MKTITWKDGVEYTGVTARHLVDQMRIDGRFTMGKTLPEYMRGVSRRLCVTNDVYVRHSNPTWFLADLANFGIITLKEWN